MTKSAARPIRVYADTSVYGGVFDKQFAEASRAFFGLVRRGRLQLVLSALVRTEIARAPKAVRTFLTDIERVAEIVEAGSDAIRLRQAYLDGGIVGRKWSADALHVAIATVSACRVIVSWNFKHIVHFQRIPLYNGINQSLGHFPIAIHSPEEMIFDDEQDD